MLEILSGIWPIVQFVGALALLIILHEVGHFIASLLLGVPVEEFGIGFPPRITTLFEAKGVKYTLNWLPFGGFVRPKGLDDPSVPGGLADSGPWVRIGVFAAGPAINFLAAAVLFAVIFLRLGSPDTGRVLIAYVDPGSPAEAVGLQVGDLIPQVGGTEIESIEHLQDIVGAHLGEAIDLTYERDGVTNTVTVVPRTDPPEGEGAIGIIMSNPTVPIPAFEALYLGADAVYRQVAAIISLPAQILRGSVSADEGRLLGYKGMYDVYTELREIDQSTTTLPSGINTLAFFGSVSVSLGLLNLLPIPALDGGRILFALPEIVLRRRIPQVYANLINLIGLTLVFLVVIYINLQDFINPVSLP